MKQESPTGSSAGYSAIELSTILAVLAILFATSLPYNFYNTRSNRSGNHATNGVALVNDARQIGQTRTETISARAVSRAFFGN